MNWWQPALVCFVSTLVAVMVVLTRGWHGRWTADAVGGKSRKHHHGAPPRIGIVPLLAGVLLGGYLLQRVGQRHVADTLMLLLLAAAPVALMGLADDVSQRVPPWWRLAGAAVSAMIGLLLLGNVVPRADVPVVDLLLTFAPVGWLVTVLLVCGFVNAINIIDGLNGFATSMSIAMAAATGVVAWQLNDVFLVQLCIILGASVAGFFIVNFPKGITFLGDGGAYFIGFMLTQIWIMLLSRHPEVTPWFVIAVAAHPTIETVFSIYRRKFMRGRSGAMTADRLHLHSLLYRRWALKILPGTHSKSRWRANSLASSALVIISTAPMIVGVIFFDSRIISISAFLLYFLIYLTIFSRFTRRGLMQAGSASDVNSRSAALAHLAGK